MLMLAGRSCSPRTGQLVQKRNISHPRRLFVWAEKTAPQRNDHIRPGRCRLIHQQMLLIRHNFQIVVICHRTAQPGLAIRSDEDLKTKLNMRPVPIEFDRPDVV